MALSQLFFYLREIFNFINNITTKLNLPIKIFRSGSSILRTYLPKGDIDLVVTYLSTSKGSINTYELCETDILAELFKALLKSYNSSSAEMNSIQFKNLEFINARTKLLHCVTSNNIDIDITVNQSGFFPPVFS